jgi:hypothetical protein
MGKKQKKPGKGKEKTERKTAKGEEKRARREAGKVGEEDDIDAILVSTLSPSPPLSASPRSSPPSSISSLFQCLVLPACLLRSVQLLF